MSKVLIIPDVHLKPWMFEKASELVSKGSYEVIVMLGDLVDDWGQEKNLKLYNETFDAAIEFAGRHPDTFWCYGNHDISYIWNKMESGFSFDAKSTVEARLPELRKALPPENVGFILRIDNTLFSHGGLAAYFVEDHFGYDDVDIDLIIAKINDMGPARLWHDDSPLWARPQDSFLRMYDHGFFQVVGHTPVTAPLLQGNVLTLDTFSTRTDGTPIGDRRFAWVDTINKTWGYAE